MDIWDALKLIARRWFVSVPLIALTLAAAVWTLVAVEPRHTSEGHIMLLPPSAEISPDEEAESVAVNPWTTESLTAATVTKLRNHALFEQLDQEGFQATWEVETDLQFDSVVVIETTSSSPEDARATVQRLLEIVQTEIDTQQAPYQLPPEAKISTLRLDGGENLAVARGNQARALVVVLGIGGILTLVITVCSDVLMRRRDRYGAPVPVSPAAAADRQAGTTPAPAPAPPPGNGNGRSPAPPPAIPHSSLPATGGLQPGITVSYRPPPSPAEVEPPAAQDVEETVVLPLARASWKPAPEAGDASGDPPNQVERE